MAVSAKWSLATVVLLAMVQHCPAKGCDRQLQGSGGCRGPNWDAGQWPILVGERNLEECCLACRKQTGCTGFHLGKFKTEHEKRSSCFLFGHQDLQPAIGLGGECYKLLKQSQGENDNGPTAEQCKKHIVNACPTSGKAEAKVKPVEVKPPKPTEAPKPAKVEVKPNLEVKKADEVKKVEQEKKKVEDEKKKELEAKKKLEEEAKLKAEKLREKELKLEQEKKAKELEQNKQKEIENKAKLVAEQKKKDEESKIKAESVKAEKEKSKKPVQPVEPERQKRSAPVETPKRADQASPKKPPQDIKIFDGKHLVKVGDGGCRGANWDRKGCPKLVGRRSKTDCAWECRKADFCTAFHILKFSKDDKTYDCLLFGHKDLITVPGLGGECYKLSEAPPKKTIKPKDEEPEFVRPVGPVRAVEVGKGMCRGKGWTFEDWPKAAGRKMAKQCTMSCVKTHGCTSFDLSVKTGNTFICNLYGHKDVVPAAGVPGTCYTLFGSSLAAKLMKEKDDLIENIIEDEIEIELKEDAKFDFVGEGACRGPGWQDNNWPKVKGPQTLQDCANACKKKKGCSSFELSSSATGSGLHQCHLFHQKNPIPASGVPAKCYKLDVDPNDEEDEEEDHVPDLHGHSAHQRETRSVIDDGSLNQLPKGGNGFEFLGDGACRGPKWTNDVWPKDEGVETFQACSDECRKDAACTAFEVSPSDKQGKFRCHLFGHDKVQPASGLRGRCYRMSGRKAVPVSAVKAEGPAAKFTKLGDGTCRGDHWQKAPWPLDKGRRSEKECYAACLAAAGCTAFETSKPNKSGTKIQCFLYGHAHVRHASGVEGTCFKMSVIKPPSEKVKSKFEGAVELSEGMCRGPHWQDGVNWPEDKGRRTGKECYAACKQISGCTSFDLSQPGTSGKKVQCYLYGHANVVPASGLPGRCFKMTSVKEGGPKKQPHSGPKSVIIADIAQVTRLEEGACRGPGWQDKTWPQVPGPRTRKSCAETCARTSGCTAFDVREVSHENHDAKPDDYECTLYGHKKVQPASGVKGECYSVTLLDPSQIPAKIPQQPTPKATAPSTPQPKKVVPAPVPQGGKPPAPPVDKKKQGKVPTFDPPKVIDDEYFTEEWLFEAPPPEVRSRRHIETILHLSDSKNSQIENVVDGTLRELKRVYENSIKPLENIYNYKELSNRHFGDPEIFNKPLIVLMGPWSGGKSSTLNYLLGTEFTPKAFKSGAEPSAGFNFNIALHGDQEEDIGGTELAAEWAFSSLQKFGQEFLRKLKGKRMPNKLLEKAIFAEIPGVLETGSVRKIDRKYPFNDACQWFIDHADLILLVYDYTKLDIGPQTELLLDQLKGRETQVRILLNKADEITAEELMKIQGNLVWNVSPLMSSSLEPPILYAGSFWSHPYKSGALKDLLRAQEIALLKDIDEAIEKRVENRISTARRFAVRVRNHAKMVDVYLARFHSQRGVFGNKKKTAEDIVNNPDKYHIYEGISTLTNISRYDLPDPQSYKTFFALHPLDEFPSLQSTCTFFKGCPINKLDLAIAYDLPELLTNHKKKVSQANKVG